MNTLKNNTVPAKRLLSLDALRGFDMFWIIGGDILFRTLGDVTGWEWAMWWGNQLDHVKWAGFHAYDLVFPLFMFLSGVTIPYALLGKLEKGVPKKELYKKVIVRALILILFGFISNGNLLVNYEKFRYVSVLGQIGLAYLIGSVIALNTKSFRSRLFWVVGILLGIAVTQFLVTIGDFGGGDFTKQNSINSFIDQYITPGRLYYGTVDGVGLLNIISASALIVMGTLAGEIIRSNRYSQIKVVGILTIIGIVLISAAVAVSGLYPINKPLWTSSFNLLTAGLSFLLLSVFYLIIDVWGFQKWSFFFQVIGLNSITIYMAVRVIDFKYTSDKLLGGLASLTGEAGPIVIFSGVIAAEWLFLYFLYKRSIFLKV